MSLLACDSLYFLFNAPATTEIYTLSLHDALPIFADGTIYTYFSSKTEVLLAILNRLNETTEREQQFAQGRDRKSTRLNSSHTVISYAVFCLKKKKKTK